MIPSLEDITLEQPEFVKQGVLASATASALIHFAGEYSNGSDAPGGNREEGEELMSLTEEFEQDPNALWERDL